MSEHVQLLAKNIEIKTLQGTVVQLSHDLASVTHEHTLLRNAFNQLNENAVKQADDLSKANVALVLEKNVIEEARGRQQERIQDMEEDLTGLRHEKERREIITNHVFKEIKGGSSIVYLPHHASLGKKVKKTDLRIELNAGHTLSGIVTHIDDMYQKLDNPELRRLLKQ